MNWKNHIVATPDTLVGKPRIKDTRVSVEQILDRLADGWSIEDVVSSYPGVTRDDVQAALAFVAEIYREESFVAVGKANA